MTRPALASLLGLLACCVKSVAPGLAGVARRGRCAVLRAHPCAAVVALVGPALAGALVGSLETLYQTGARRITMADLPPLGQVPFFQDLLEAGAIDLTTVQGANLWSLGYNLSLAAGLAQFQQAHADEAVIPADKADGVSRNTEPPVGLLATSGQRVRRPV